MNSGIWRELEATVVNLFCTFHQLSVIPLTVKLDFWKIIKKLYLKLTTLDTQLEGMKLLLCNLLFEKRFAAPFPWMHGSVRRLRIKRKQFQLRKIGEIYAEE